MIVGMPKETKNEEYRVAMVPSSAAAFIRNGHEVYVESNAGKNAGFTDEEYEAAGAVICDTKTIYEKSDMIYKVKEVLPAEFNYYKEGQILFTYIHSACRPEMTKALLDSKIIGIAYEDIDDDEGRLPLLAPMSEIAGKGAFIAAFNYKQTLNGGKGKLLSRVCGLETPRIMIIGCGNTGMAAAEYASAFGNHVTMLDINRRAMENAHNILPANVEIIYSNRENILDCLKRADVIINCIMWDQRNKGHIIYKEDLSLMKPDAIIIDVSSDDAGAVETCHMTTHDDPVYIIDGILHYCVPNIPSLYANSASILLSARTLPYALKIAAGFEKALKEDKHLQRGLSFYRGLLTNKENAEANNLNYTSVNDLIKSF